MTCGTTTWRRSRRSPNCAQRQAGRGRHSGHQDRLPLHLRPRQRLALFPIVEKPVPQDAVPGEHPSPTQPYPLAPPALTRQAPVTPDEPSVSRGSTPAPAASALRAIGPRECFSRRRCRARILQPGNGGGANWGGIAFDPNHQLAVVNTMNLPFRGGADSARPELQAQTYRASTRTTNSRRQTGRPTSCAVRFQLGSRHLRASSRRGALLSAVDMEHGTIRWQIPLGVTPGIHLNVGMPSVGGPIVTASGLVFIAATLDDRLRAFDLQRQEPVGRETAGRRPGDADDLFVGGRQYLVIAAGGTSRTGPPGAITSWLTHCPLPVDYGIRSVPDAFLKRVGRQMRAEPRFLQLAANFSAIESWKLTDKWPDFRNDEHDCKIEAARPTAAR